MSAAKQGFVQAFSRRNDGGRLTLTPQATDASIEPVGNHPAGDASLNDSPDNVPPSQSFGLEFDESISDSASIWIDQDDGGVLRIDQVFENQDTELAANPEPNSGSNGTNRSGSREGMDLEERQLVSDSMQHTLTAYGESHLLAGEIDFNLREMRANEAVGDEQAAIHNQIDLTQSCFQPAWEVKAFQIPRVIDQLFLAEGLLSTLSQRLREAASNGLSNIWVTSVHSGEGKTSVAIGLALSAAAANLKVAMIDADVSQPSVIDQLQLDVEHGWNELSELVPLEEIAVCSRSEKMTIFPLKDRLSIETSERVQFSDLLSQVQSHFDLVVIDGGCQKSFMREHCAQHIDSSVIVQNLKKTETTAVARYAEEINRSGIRSVGVVENHA